MRLADFIENELPAILASWDEFAGSQLPAANQMSFSALRDHGADILAAIAKDLRQPQTEEEQETKSRGMAQRLPLAAATAAETHAFLRAGHGFSVNQLAAEYRALRSSVLRLWAAQGELGAADLQDMVRFNEAIDQGLAESVAVFSQRVGEARDLTLGMFGHDLRNPLSAIRLSAILLKKRSESPEVTRIVTVIESACRQMTGLLEDLVDFNRVRLGLGLQIDRSEIDLFELCQEEVHLIRAAYPDRQLELAPSDPCIGQFDGKRLQQLLGNLLVNALTHGLSESPVQMRLCVTGDLAVIDVRNRGATIEQADLQRIFEPLKRAKPQHTGRDPSGSLGLGLYISQEIAAAHGGSISAVSRDGETVFSVSLPRRL